MSMLETLARVAFRLVARTPSPSDEQVIAELVMLGATQEVAQRIMLFAPTAAARVAYAAIMTFPDTYGIQLVAGGYASYPLGEEPAFAACMNVARARGAAGIDAMLRRSATFNIVSAMQRRNANLKNLEAGPMTLLTESWGAPAATTGERSVGQRLRGLWLSHFG